MARSDEAHARVDGDAESKQDEPDHDEQGGSLCRLPEPRQASARIRALVIRGTEQAARPESEPDDGHERPDAVEPERERSWQGGAGKKGYRRDDGNGTGDDRYREEGTTRRRADHDGAMLGSAGCVSSSVVMGQCSSGR